MSQAFPVAGSLEEALSGHVPAARTKAEAARAAAPRLIARLETSWLHLPPQEASRLFEAAGPNGAQGHIQRYEDTAGHAVVAVSWWKLADPGTARQPDPAPEIAPTATAGDHTDDLYFRRGRTKPKRRKVVDPNQLDLFDGRQDG